MVAWGILIFIFVHDFVQSKSGQLIFIENTIKIVILPFRLYTLYYLLALNFNSLLLLSTLSLLLKTDPCYFYGYVYFRQIKDRSARRGYFQKSLVILTRLPFVNFFNQLIAVIAPQYFETDESTLLNGMI